MEKSDTDGRRPEKLREDLESIKDLLNKDAADIPTLRDPDSSNAPEPDVPTLDDTVDIAGNDQTLPDSTFKTLLSDAWQESVADLFAERGARFNQQDLLPEDITALTQALRSRIDKSVRQWLEDTLRSNIDLLRERMVHELSEELLQNLRERTDTQTQRNGKDGQ